MRKIYGYYTDKQGRKRPLTSSKSYIRYCMPDKIENLKGTVPLWVIYDLEPSELSSYSLDVFDIARSGGFRKLPDRLYHATANSEKIMQSGFKTAKELGHSGFGGHGTYISFTTLENARKYRDNMRLATEIVNGMITFDELVKKVEKIGGSRAKEFVLWKGDKMRKSGEDLNDPKIMFEVFSGVFFADPKNFVLFVGFPSSLVGKSPDDVKIVEARPVRKLRIAVPHAISWMSDEELKDRYMYHDLETEWRVYDSKAVEPIRIVE